MLQVHSDDLVVGLATAIAVLDVFFILVAVPESLPEKLRLSSSWSAHISWEQADPFTVSVLPKHTGLSVSKVFYCVLVCGENMTDACYEYKRML